MLELVAPELGGEAAEHGGDERDEREGRHRVDVAEDVLEPVDVDRACAVQSEALRQEQDADDHELAVLEGDGQRLEDADLFGRRLRRNDFLLGLRAENLHRDAEHGEDHSQNKIAHVGVLCGQTRLAAGDELHHERGADVGEQQTPGGKRAAFGRILRDDGVQGAVGQVDHCVEQNDECVQNDDICRLDADGPFRMRPEQQGCCDEQRSRGEHDPRTVAAPAGAGAVSQIADDRGVDRVPEAAQQEHQRDGRCGNQESVGEVDRKEGADIGPAEVVCRVDHTECAFLP